MNSKTSSPVLGIAIAIVLVINIQGCSDATVEDNATIVSTEKIASKTPVQNKGTVISVNNAAGYSYLEVDVSGDVFWVATAVTKVTPGDKIAWKGYAMMTDFKSKSLNKSFDQILFVDQIFSESSLATRSHTGIVIDTMNSAGYSYILVEELGNKVWLAAPQTQLSIGQAISWNSGAPMYNFNSQSLNRSFDEIFFVSEVLSS